MKRWRLLVLAAALVVGLGTAVVETRLIFAQRGQIRELTRQFADTTQQLAVLRHQRDGTARDLALAEQQLSRLPPIAVAIRGPATGARELGTDTWAARTRQLRALVADNSSQVVPEIQLLTDEDWMRVAQHAAFETDAQRRAALATLRTAAKEKFITRLSAAAQKWTLAEGLDKAPANVAELASRFEPPVDPAILQRYEIVPARPSSRAGWQVREIAAIDEDYDNRYSVEATGSYGSSGRGPLTWNADYSSRVQRAYRAYATANPGVGATGIAQIVPYIDPPLPAPVIDKLLRAERERKP